MGYYDREDAPVHEPDARVHDLESGNHTAMGVAGATAEILIRLIGLALVIVGLWVAINVVLEAWGLYRHPEAIESFAQHIHGISQSAAGATASAAVDYRLAYVMAWLLSVVLLLLSGRLAFWAIQVGGGLTLANTGSSRETGRQR